MDDDFPDPERVALNIGWDYGVHRRRLPAEATHHAFAQGYAEGKKRPARDTPEPVRKWLQIRFNAWTRKRIVRPEVTAGYLAFLLNDMKCPVSQIDLTYRTVTENDWSIDRVNNDGAYATGNLAVLSTRVNAAKGGMTYADVCARADGVISDESLTRIEWARLASLMEGPCGVAGVEIRPMPFLAHGLGVVKAPNQILQALVLAAVFMRTGPLTRNIVLAKLGHRSREHWLPLRRRLERHGRKSPPDWPFDLFCVPSVWDAYLKWFNGLTDEERRGLLDLYAEGYGQLPTSGDRQYAQSFGVATRGFFDRR